MPPPRTHRHRYFGVLAPNSPLRSAVTALSQGAPAPPVAAQVGQATAGEGALGTPPPVLFALADGFEWETAQIEADSRRNYRETRFIATGVIAQRVHVLIFCFRETKIRLISLRRANHREVKRYARNH